MILFVLRVGPSPRGFKKLIDVLLSGYGSHFCPLLDGVDHHLLFFMVDIGCRGTFPELSFLNAAKKQLAGVGLLMPRYIFLGIDFIRFGWVFRVLCGSMNFGKMANYAHLLQFGEGIFVTT